MSERVLRDERRRLVVEPPDVLLELLGLDAPLTAATDLHRRKVPRADECVRLRGRDAQHLCDIGESQEPRRAHLGSLASRGVSVLSWAGLCTTRAGATA